ncbi:hypothetical protein Hanom_Chr10g00886951 [Helianthus anomalus]
MCNMIYLVAVVNFSCLLNERSSHLSCFLFMISLFHRSLWNTLQRFP